MDFTFLDRQQVQFQNKEEFQARLEIAIKYLIGINDAAKIVLDPRASVALDYFRQASSDFEIISKFMNVIEIFSNVLSYTKKDLISYVNTYETLNELKDANGVEKLYISQFQLSFKTVLICWNASNRSKEFKYKFYDCKGFEAMLSYISDETFVKNCTRFKFPNTKRVNSNEQPGVRFLRAIIGTMNNVSKIADDVKQSMNKLNAAQIIMKFAINMKEYLSHRMSAYMAAANILNDNEIETLPDTKLVVHDIISLISVCSNALKTKKGIQRDMVTIDGKNERRETVFIVSTNLSNYHIIELLQVLYKIAVNDTIKMELFDSFKLSVHLEILILEGNLTEKEYSLRCLWQLCFQASIAQRVHENKKLYEYICELVSSENTNVQKFSNGIIWSIDRTKPQETKDDQIQNSPTNEKKTKQHIMISYNSYSRELCMNVKRELENLEYKIWIDVEEIHGSSLDAMALAIESSHVVLICLTERYKLSPNCRAEAEYAFKLNVPIIPLIMQKNYVPDGWLGILMGSKIYINFTKNTFPECISRLNSEIKSAMNVKEIEAPVPTKKAIRLDYSKKQAVTYEVEKWSENDVTKWVERNNFDSIIIAALKEFDGRMLKHLHSIKNSAPEYFYSTISQNKTLNLKACVKFSLELDELLK